MMDEIKMEVLRAKFEEWEKDAALAAPVAHDQAQRDLMPKRAAFVAWAQSHHLETDEDKDTWGRRKFKHPHIESMWEGWFNAPTAAPLPPAAAPAPELTEDKRDAERCRTQIEFLPAEAEYKSNQRDGMLFEAWARTCDGNCNDRDLRKVSPGTWAAIDGETYLNLGTERDWTVWQAARASLPPPSAEPVAIMRDGPEGAWAELTSAGESLPEGALCYAAASPPIQVAPEQASVRKALEIGATMGNVLYNLAQRQGYVLTDADWEMYGDLRKKWDAIRALISKEAT